MISSDVVADLSSRQWFKVGNRIALMESNSSLGVILFDICLSPNIQLSPSVLFSLKLARSLMRTEFRDSLASTNTFLSLCSFSSDSRVSAILPAIESLKFKQSGDSSSTKVHQISMPLLFSSVALHTVL